MVDGMNLRHFPLVAGALITATPAAAQPAARPPVFSVHHDATSCWVTRDTGNAPETSVVLGRDIDGGNWFRASGSGWEIVPDRVYRLRVRGTPGFGSPPTEGSQSADLVATGRRDANGWSGLEVRGGNPQLAYWMPALALYSDEEPEPFATIANPYSGSATALRDCAAELYRNDRGSGEPPEIQAVPSRRTYVTNDDYPAAALRAEEQGTTAVRITVSAHGMPTDCAVTESSGSARLDSTTCALLMRRIHFVPARDAAGRATQGSFTVRYRWSLPGDGDPAK